MFRLTIALIGKSSHLYEVQLLIRSLHTVTKLLSHLEKNVIFVLPFPHVNVVLKKVPDRDDTRDSATFCGTATLTRGKGGKQGLKNRKTGDGSTIL